MARIKHIALTTQNPDKVAAFYKEAFGWKEIRRSPNGAVFLTDGAINVAILNWKTEKDADVGANGPNYNGIHHFGVQVDDLGEASDRLDAAQARRLTQKHGIDGRHVVVTTSKEVEHGRARADFRGLARERAGRSLDPAHRQTVPRPRATRRGESARTKTGRVPDAGRHRAGSSRAGHGRGQEA